MICRVLPLPLRINGPRLVTIFTASIHPARGKFAHAHNVITNSLIHFFAVHKVNALDFGHTGLPWVTMSWDESFVSQYVSNAGM